MFFFSPQPLFLSFFFFLSSSRRDGQASKSRGFAVNALDEEAGFAMIEKQWLFVMGKFGVLHPPDTRLGDAQSYLVLTGGGKRVGPSPSGVGSLFHECYSDRGCYLVPGKPVIPRRHKPA